jgi:branched-chain amino acid aminotransferase
MSRFKKSSTRASLPDFDGAELLKVLEEFVHVEEQFIPPFKGFSLYLRPFHISM